MEDIYAIVNKKVNCGNIKLSDCERNRGCLEVNNKCVPKIEVGEDEDDGDLPGLPVSRENKPPPTISRRNKPLFEDEYGVSLGGSTKRHRRKTNKHRKTKHRKSNKRRKTKHRKTKKTKSRR